MSLRQTTLNFARTTQRPSPPSPQPRPRRGELKESEWEELSPHGAQWRLLDEQLKGAYFSLLARPLAARLEAAEAVRAQAKALDWLAARHLLLNL